MAAPAATPTPTPPAATPDTAAQVAAFQQAAEQRRMSQQNLPATQEGEEPDANRAILEHLAMQEIRSNLRDEEDALRAEYPSLTHAQFLEYETLTAEGKTVEAARIIAQVAKERDELKAKEEKEDLKESFTEGPGGVPGNRNEPPKTLDEAEGQALAMLA